MIIDRLDVDLNTPLWFAMQATQKREITAQKSLKEAGIESFIPMHNALVTKNGRKQIELKPVVPNLMFIYATKAYMRDIKTYFPYLQFKYRTEGGLYYPITVPAKQMQDFIKLYEATDHDKMIFMSPNDMSLQLGKRVRIHSSGNKLDGIEGQLVKVKGKRNRQLSITIENYMTMVAAVDIDLLEIID